jgi:N-acetylmuramoyl-L-alanine amidase
MRQIKEIILHCSATREGKAFTASDIDRWHRERGWKGCGYHYVITLDGKVEQGRPEQVVGAHCTGRNSESIGVCYIGGCDMVGKSKDTRTPEQKKAMVTLVRQLMQAHGIGIEDVRCHNEFSSKACPSFSIEKFRKELEEA